VETKEGKASITKEDLEQIIKDSYDEGFSDGIKSATTPITYPVYPYSPMNPYPPDYYKVTCSKEDAKKIAESMKNTPL